MARPDQVYYLHEATEKKMAFARCVRSGGYLHVSGCGALTEAGVIIGKGDMLAQMRAVYETLEHILGDHGADFSHVIKEVFYTTDMAAMVAANGVRADAYENSAPPAATGVEVSALVHPDMLIEIELTAEDPAAR